MTTRYLAEPARFPVQRDFYRALDEFFTGIEELVATAPEDAGFKHDGTKAWVVPGVDGEKLDRVKTAEAVAAAAMAPR